MQFIHSPPSVPLSLPSPSSPLSSLPPSLPSLPPSFPISPPSPPSFPISPPSPPSLPLPSFPPSLPPSPPSRRSKNTSNLYLTTTLLTQMVTLFSMHTFAEKTNTKMSVCWHYRCMVTVTWTRECTWLYPSAYCC